MDKRKDEEPGGPSRSAAEVAARRPQEWSTQDKLRALVETTGLEGGELGEYLRRSGLHRDQLESWRGTVAMPLEQPANSAGGRRTAADTKRIKELERELPQGEGAGGDGGAAGGPRQIGPTSCGFGQNGGKLEVVF
jgi:hypothetical protein